MNRVIPNLYISSMQGVKEYDFEGGDIDVVVSVCPISAKSFVSDNCTYEKYEMGEGISEITPGVLTQELFTSSANCVLGYVQDNSVLVHCQMGENRSVAVVTAVVAVRKNMSYETALQLVKSEHEKANPTQTLEKCAREYIREKNRYLC